MPVNSTAADWNLGFAWRSFRAIDAVHAHGDNTTYSPYSAATALQMLANGADRGVEAPLLAALCSTGDITAMNAHARALRASLGSSDEVTTANGIWTSPNHTARAGLAANMARDFGGDIGAFEYGQAKPMNDWVARHTKRRIPTIIGDDDLGPNMVMVLINALTFDGTWKTKFEPARPMPFHGIESEAVDVPMLQDTQTWDYAFSESDSQVAFDPELQAKHPDAFHMARLPYQGDRYAMDVIVPVAEDGLDAVLDRIGPKEWRELQRKLAPTPVMLQLPKVKLNEGRNIEKQLFALGVPQGTYNRLVREHEQPIVIEYVIQKTFLEVDEQGTKAAAATAVGTGIGAGGPVGIPVTADHPYLVVIEDIKTHELLFISAIRDPAAP
ncbi:MAG: hypothetical protein JWN72_1790 [Thermoleophilia bacterium]|nr:hypothetical protein [Thermoleophilia bacterium]